MNSEEALRFVESHGVALAAANGPVPRVSEVIAGESMHGSWWGHPKVGEIYATLGSLQESPDVLVCRVVVGEITFVHRLPGPAHSRRPPIPIGAPRHDRAAPSPIGTPRALPDTGSPLDGRGLPRTLNDAASERPSTPWATGPHERSPATPPGSRRRGEGTRRVAAHDSVTSP